MTEIFNCRSGVILAILGYVLVFQASGNVVSSAKLPDPIVETSKGKIQGSILYARQNERIAYYSFKGIPYAKAPLGALRFQPPQEADSWEGVRPAEQYGSKCTQFDLRGGPPQAIVGSEDCLYLNVYTTELNPANLKPVLVWIHGGSYIAGGGEYFNPDYLVEEDVILVTINYRLGIFGFFTVNDEPAYGNQGFRDQIAALKWVAANIRYFGGDPDKVTLAGQSAGCDSIAMLLFSSQIKGLFKQYICESGSALKARNLQRNQLKYTHRLANYFNISTESTKTIVQELQKIDAVTLYNAAISENATGFKMTLRPMPWFPIIEVDHPMAIVSERPYKLLEEGLFEKIPFIFGHTSEENTFGYSLINRYMNISDFDEDPTLFVSVSMNDPPNPVEVGRAVRSAFLGNSSARDVDKFSRYIGEDMYIRSIKRELEMKRNYQEGFFYNFDYKGTYSSKIYPGVGHGEEIQYIFYDPTRQANLTDTDILMRKRMVRMWTNFVKFGNPTPAEDDLINIIWEPSNKTIENYFNIDVTLKQGPHPNQEDFVKWHDLFDKYAVKPFVTY